MVWEHKFETRQKIKKQTKELRLEGKHKQFLLNAELRHALDQIQTTNHKQQAIEDELNSPTLE